MSACTKIENEREMMRSHDAIRIYTIEQLQPDPLVDMTSDELNKLCKESRYYADKIDNLICPTCANPCLILIEMGELEELVDDYDLSGHGLVHMQGLTMQ
jgi:hypothetical protein